MEFAVREWKPYLFSRATDFAYENGLGKGGLGSYVPMDGMEGAPDVVKRVADLLPHPSVLSPEEADLIPRALFSHGDQVMISEFGTLPARFGKDFKHGWNDNRPISYFYGLAAPKGTPVPSLAELASRDAEIKSELSKLLDALNDGRDVASEASTFQFKGGDYGNHEWDKAAQAAGEGVAPTRTVFSEVERLIPRINEAVPEGIYEGLGDRGSKKNFVIQNTKGHSPIRPDSTGGMGRPRQTPSGSLRKERGISGGTLTRLVVVCIAVFAGFWALNEVVRRLDANHDKNNDTGRRMR